MGLLRVAWCGSQGSRFWGSRIWAGFGASGFSEFPNIRNRPSKRDRISVYFLYDEYQKDRVLANGAILLPLLLRLLLVILVTAMLRTTYLPTSLPTYLPTYIPLPPLLLLLVRVLLLLLLPLLPPLRPQLPLLVGSACKKEDRIMQQKR